MSQKMNRMVLSTLRNSEFTIFVNQVAGITVKHNPNILHLAKPFEKLNLLLPEMAKIKAHEQGSVLSNKLHDLDYERDLLLNAIMAQVKTLSKLNLPSLKPHTTVLNNFFDKHGHDIANATYNAETKRIEDLLADYENTSDVKSAFAGLNIDILINQLKVVNKDFADLFMQRNEAEAAAEKVNTRAIRLKTERVFIDFLNAIEYCSTEYEELDYTPLCNELNDLITYYKTQLKARITRRNTGKDISVEPAIEK
ncbi:MAG: DUF6261 family protein [Bacteroidetes bacterium]|nr:DUF6261 family protein [Bacteroidota bacterium]